MERERASFLQAVFENMTDDELNNVFTINRNNYQDDDLKIAYRVAENRKNNTSQGFNIGDLSAGEKNEWFYITNGKRNGPISENEMYRLYNNQVFLNTKVWKSGMPEWIPLAKTELAASWDLPPLVKGSDINNTLVWILVFVPIIGVILRYMWAGSTEIPYGAVWMVPIALNSILCIWDERRIRRLGYNTKELLLWAIFLVPVYLFRRAILLNQSKGYAIVWCIVFVISFLI